MTSRDDTRSRLLLAFEERAQHADLVTFDLFDTLAQRLVRRPVDVFAIVADALRDAIPNHAGVFARDREEAERAARIEAEAAGRHEITLDEIYRRLPAPLIDEASAAGVSIDQMQVTEIDLELASIVPDELVVGVFRRVVAAGVPVAIVSDMYLPADVLHRILDKIGVEGHAALHLSGEIGVSKAKGSIWDHVRRAHDLSEASRIVHIGDNAESDGATARLQGVDSFVLPLPPRTLPRSRLAEDDHWLVGACEVLLERALAAGAVKAEDDSYWVRVAYLVALPVALGMAGFVAEVARSRGERRVFFLARDGLIFQRVYEAVFRRDEEPPSGYLYASRRCLNVANITALDDQALDFLCSDTVLLSPNDYLRRIDIDVSDPVVAREVRSHFVNPDDAIEPAQKPALRAMFQALEPVIVAGAATEREALLQHLDANGFFGGRPLVVDLGWHGSLQRSLIRLGRIATGAPIDVDGAYLGTMPATPEAVDGRPVDMRGWLFERGMPADVMEATVRASVEVVELLFSAPTAGIRCVQIDGPDVRPVELHDEREEPRLAVARIIHQEVERGARLLAPLIRVTSPAALKQVAIERLTTFQYYPDRDDIRHFRRIVHAEGFGKAEYRPIISTPKGAWSRHELVQSYYASFWRTGFMASLNPIQRLFLRLLFWKRGQGIARHEGPGTGRTGSASA